MYDLIKVDDNTWCYQAVMPDGDSVRFFVLNADECCLCLDSGYMETDVKGMVRDLLRKEGIDKKADGREKEILLANTHGDMDHTGGNASFDSFYLTQTDYDNCAVGSRCPDSKLIPVQDGTQIDLGGRKLKYYLAPGHTYGNAVILDETNRILFPGDMVQTGTMFMFGPHRCPEKLEESLIMLQGHKNEFDKIYACHGQTVMDPDAVDKTLAAWRKVINKEVTPEKRNVFNTDVYMYDCGFCRFFANLE